MGGDLSVLIGSLIGIMIVGISYFLIAGKRKHLQKWTLFWGFSFISYLSLSAFWNYPSGWFFGIVFNLAYILSSYFLISGIYCFFKIAEPAIWKYITAIFVMSPGLGFVSSQLVILAELAPFIYATVIYIECTRLFYRHAKKFRVKIMTYFVAILACMPIVLFLLFHSGLYLIWYIANGAMICIKVCFSFGLLINSYENLESSLKQSQKRYKTLFETMGSTVAVIDEDTTLSVINQAGEKLLGYPKQEVEEKKSYLDFVAPKDKARVARYHKQRLKEEGKAPRNYEINLIDANGDKKWVEVTEDIIFNTRQSVASIIDLTERKRMTEELENTKIKLEKLHETAFKMSQLKTEKEVYNSIIKATTNIFDFTLSIIMIEEDSQLEIKGRTEGIETSNVNLLKEIADKTYRVKKTFSIDQLVNNKYKSIISTPVGDLGVFQVVSKEKNRFKDAKLVELLANHIAETLKRIRFEDKIKYVSFHDALTGLYNRAYVEKEIDRLDNSKNLPISIIVADVNSLKLVNDAFGHEMGDQLLIKTGEILEKSCSEKDIVARFGGDEFVILAPQTNAQEIELIRKKIKQNCADISSLPVPLSIATGAATKKEVEQNPNIVYKKADERMYDNKLKNSRIIENSLLKALLEKLYENSFEDQAHFIKMTKLGFELAEAIGLSCQELEKLFVLISLYEIGKVTIAKRILNKAEELTEKEWKLIKEHPKAGYQIVSSTEQYAFIAPEILYHHEHWDGSGYPEGLAGEEIPFLGRLVSILDAYESMLSGSRPYKEKKTVEEARAELKKEAGSQFDPYLVEMFFKHAF